jgi:uncharacterized protein involved in outer membrane biogenesis
LLKNIKKTIFYLLIIYGFLGFLIPPFILKPKITEIVQKETNSKITIDSFYFNPFVFTMDISGIKLKTLDNKPLIFLKSLNVDFELYSLFNSTIHIKKFILKEPKIFLVYNKDKTINLAKIIKKSNDKSDAENDAKSTKLPRVVLDRIAIQNGVIDYKDYTHKSEFDFSFHNIGFELRDVDSENFNKSDEEIRFYSLLGDGGFIDLRTDIIGIEPLEIKGSLDFKASKLYTEWRYLQDSLNLEVADGKIALYTKYYFNLDDLNATSINNLQLSLDSLRIKPKNGFKDVLNLNSLNIEDVTIKPMLQDVDVKDITLNSLYVKVKRDSNGAIDWVEYLKNNSHKVDENTTKKGDTTATPWHVKVQEIALKKIKVDFHDDAIKPSVDTKLNELNLHLQNVTLAGDKPLHYQMDLLLNDDFNCSSNGQLTHKNLFLDSYLKCSGFDITHYNPYINKAAKESLKVYDLSLQNAQLAFDLNLSVKDVQKQTVLDINRANVDVTNFILNKNSTKERLIKFDNFSVDGISLNTKTKEVKILDTVLNRLDIKTKRLKNGVLNIEDLVVAHAKPKTKKSKTNKEKEYKIFLKHFGLKSAKVVFDDEVLSPKVQSKIDKIDVDVYGISSAKKSELNYALSLRLNNSGKLKAKGTLRHTPLKQKGSFVLEKISLKDITPYLQQKAFVSIDDGFLSIKGKTEYEKNKNKPDLRLNGSLKLESLFVSDSRDKTPLLSFSDIEIDPFTYEMAPNRFFVDEMRVNSFYVNAIVDKDKKMNFASILKPESKKSKALTQDINTTKSDDNFPVKIMKVDISMGSAKFADLSLPIEFHTNIHDLNGVVYAISNQKDETSFVNISGEVDEYGSTKLKGSINTANPKAYTDLDFNFRNLELNPVSGYSASFAGYEIDSGKLYLDLGYDILDSQMVGDNSIIIKNIKLGKEFEDENVTSLPLGFVIALLEDSDGIIDIEMPVEGNVDEPDFKYGKLVWKTFANLIVKAVASPFKFLGSMMGIDGEKLEFIDFEYGMAKILPPEKEKLDMIAKMMIKRPKISLSIIPQYDEMGDKKELQKEKLIALLLKKSGIKNKEKHENIMTVDLLEDVYGDLKNTKEIKKIKKELRKQYKGDEFDRAYLNVLIEECIKIQPLGMNELKILAERRAKILKSYLVDKKTINPLRINLLKGVSVDDRAEKYVKTKLEIVVK